VVVEALALGLRGMIVMLISHRSGGQEWCTMYGSESHKAKAVVMALNMNMNRDINDLLINQTDRLLPLVLTGSDSGTTPANQ
jgi:hypothetical protein